MRIAEALRLLRTREGLTQTAASKRPEAPDFRTLSHWETRRKMPSLKLLDGYLRSLGRDFHDLQDALDQIEGKTPKRLELADKLLREGLEKVARDPDFCRMVTGPLDSGIGDRLDDLERRLRFLEPEPDEADQGSAEHVPSEEVPPEAVSPAEVLADP